MAKKKDTKKQAIGGQGEKVDLGPRAKVKISTELLDTLAMKLDFAVVEWLEHHAPQNIKDAHSLMNDLETHITHRKWNGDKEYEIDSRGAEARVIESLEMLEELGVETSLNP